MKTPLSIDEVSSVETFPCRIDLDEFVPLRFRTYERPLGAGYIRLGNYSTTLLELIIEPRARVLRGATITSYDVLSDWPDLRVTSESDGLPVLSVTFDRSNRIDLREDFRVAVKSNEVLVFWGDLIGCNQSNFAKVHCLDRDGQMRGIRFSELSEEEVNLFASHARRSVKVN
jgi:hypothetical protein